MCRGKICPGVNDHSVRLEWFRWDVLLSMCVCRMVGVSLRCEVERDGYVLYIMKSSVSMLFLAQRPHTLIPLPATLHQWLSSTLPLPNIQSQCQLKTYYCRPGPLKWEGRLAACAAARLLAAAGVNHRAWAGLSVRSDTASREGWQGKSLFTTWGGRGAAIEPCSGSRMQANSTKISLSL